MSGHVAGENWHPILGTAAHFERYEFYGVVHRMHRGNDGVVHRRVIGGVHCGVGIQEIVDARLVVDPPVSNLVSRISRRNQQRSPGGREPSSVVVANQVLCIVRELGKVGIVEGAAAVFIRI